MWRYPWNFEMVMRVDSSISRYNLAQVMNQKRWFPPKHLPQAKLQWLNHILKYAVYTVCQYVKVYISWHINPSCFPPPIFFLWILFQNARCIMLSSLRCWAARWLHRVWWLPGVTRERHGVGATTSRCEVRQGTEIAQKGVKICDVKRKEVSTLKENDWKI